MLSCFDNKPEVNLIINELERTKSLIAAMLGIYRKDSLYEKLDAKGRFENTLLAIKMFFRAESIIRPLIVILDDIQWIDEDSKTTVQLMTRKIEDQGIIFFALSRYYDDGSKPELSLDNNIEINEISFGTLKVILLSVNEVSPLGTVTVQVLSPLFVNV